VSGATDLADAFLAYTAATSDWLRQEELWEQMKVHGEVHRAEKRADAVRRLEGI
jgi:hypothetical protein